MARVDLEADETRTFGRILLGKRCLLSPGNNGPRGVAECELDETRAQSGREVEGRGEGEWAEYVFLAGVGS